MWHTMTTWSLQRTPDCLYMRNQNGNADFKRKKKKTVFFFFLNHFNWEVARIILLFILFLEAFEIVLFFFFFCKPKVTVLTMPVQVSFSEAHPQLHAWNIHVRWGKPAQNIRKTDSCKTPRQWYLLGGFLIQLCRAKSVTKRTSCPFMSCLSLQQQKVFCGT